MTARRASWRRRAVRAAVCLLLLGAVTTVGVAWGCQLRVDPMRSAGRTGQMVVALDHQHCRIWWMGGSTWTLAQAGIDVLAGDEAAERAAEWEREYGSLEATRSQRAAIESMRGRAPVTSLRGTAVMRAAPMCITPTRAPEGIGGYHFREIMAWGWPFRSVAHIMWERKEVAGEQADKGEHGSAMIAGRRFSCAPLWPGFLLDTLFYAVPWWMLLLAPGLVKRWRRKRRGACVVCGYDLRGLGEEARCPECGT